MEDQIQDMVEMACHRHGHMLSQLERMREFKDRMKIAGAFPRPEQFSVPKVTPLEPRRSIAIHR